jgi:alcohol dehydrogenase (cytochrome c)
MILQTKPGSKWAPGGINYGGNWSVGKESPRGWITAVDATSGAVRWRYHASSPIVSGVAPTAGGIVIAGDNDGNFLILNSATGAVLKKVSSGGSLSGGVITYEQQGKQYVAFTSGNISISAFGAIGHPSIVVMSLPTPVGKTEGPGDAGQRGEQPDVLHGQKLFNAKCAVCHGFDGTSLDLNGENLRTIGRRKTLQQLIDWIKNPAPPMPKVYPEPLQRVDESEIADIASYVSAWSK